MGLQAARSIRVLRRPDPLGVALDLIKRDPRTSRFADDARGRKRVHHCNAGPEIPPVHSARDVRVSGTGYVPVIGRPSGRSVH